MTNFVSRPIIGIGTFMTEYIANPMILVCVFSSLSIGTTYMIEEPKIKDEIDEEIIEDEISENTDETYQMVH